MDSHFWAFYWYCRRQGDHVRFYQQGGGKANLYVKKKEGAKTVTDEEAIAFVREFLDIDDLLDAL